MKVALVFSAILLTLVVALASYIWFGIEHALFEAVYPAREFDPAGWQQDGPIARACMVRDMYRKFDFTEMTRGEIASLLGQPDRASEFLDSYGRQRTSAEYKLDRGVRSSFWPFGEPWYQYMSFEFDENGLCTSVSENN